jgi:hypothetical protein
MARKTRKASSAKPDAPPRIPGVPIGNPIDELASAIDSRTLELINTHLQIMLTGAAVPVETVLHLPGRQRLYDAIRKFHDWFLETKLSVDQLRATKTKAPGKDTLIADRINRTLERLGHDEEAIRRFWSEFYSEDGPVEPDAQRKAVSRAARR